MKLTPAQLRELRCISETCGNPTDPDEWYGRVPDSLWFYCREKVLGALLRKGLIVDDGGFELTDAGCAALTEAQEKAQ